MLDCFGYAINNLKAYLPKNTTFSNHIDIKQHLCVVNKCTFTYIVVPTATIVIPGSSDCILTAVNVNLTCTLNFTIICQGWSIAVACSS